MCNMFALPAITKGCIRVFRVEDKDCPTSGATAEGLDLSWWNDYPTPCQDDMPDHGECIEKPGWVCAAFAHTLHKWFPESIHKEIEEHDCLRLVVLDVPKQYIVLGNMQAVIKRKHAIVVAVLH